MVQSKVSGKKLVLVGGTLSIIVLFGITYTFRTFGWSRFVANANLQEGKSNVVYISRSIAACALKTGALPPSSHQVPGDLSQVGGRKIREHRRGLERRGVHVRRLSCA